MSSSAYGPIIPSMDAAAALLACRAADGGYGVAAGAPSEPESTALASLALADADARSWLERAQVDGAVVFHAGTVVRDLTAVSVLALPSGASRADALSHLEGAQAPLMPDSPEVPHDPSTRGWSWTTDTFGWVEPTSWATVALRKYRPGSAAIDDGLAVLADRECVGGGWNYGNAEAFGVELPPFAQTTAAALLALQGTGSPLAERGASALRRLLTVESVGPLSAAMSAVVLRLLGDAGSSALADRAVRDLAAVDRPDAITLAWIVLASEPARAMDAFGL
jgi:hypothetical protein